MKDNEEYLIEIKEFLEGTKDLKEWYMWWDENKLTIKEKEKYIFENNRAAIRWNKQEKSREKVNIGVNGRSDGKMDGFLEISPMNLSLWARIAIDILEHHHVSFSLKGDNVLIFNYICSVCGKPIISSWSNKEIDKALSESIGILDIDYSCPDGCSTFRVGM